jgi:hypothetical protein
LSNPQQGGEVWEKDGRYKVRKSLGAIRGGIEHSRKRQVRFDTFDSAKPIQNIATWSG